MKNIFTKKESSDIIKEDYNPLKVNEKIYEKGSGLFKMKNGLLKEISKGLKWREMVILYMFPNTFIKIYKQGISFGFNNK